MTLDTAVSAAAILVMLVFSAFFAGSETALTAVSKARMHYLSTEGSRRATLVERLIGDRERLIGVLLFGNTFANILASTLATSLALSLFDQGGVVIATGVMTVVILIFSEVLPKTLAIARTDRFALNVALPVRLIVALLAPVVDAVQFAIWRVLGLFGVREEEAKPAITAQEEIRGAIMIHHQEGTVEREHRNMLGGILDLAELRVGDVMVHRRNMDVLDASASPEEIVERILASGHTRLPIWRDDPENIVGVLHIRDLLRVLIERGDSLAGFDIIKLATMPWFVPETTTLEEQLEAFRDRHEHFALVVDEYGVLQGIVTLEDILEEIFGKIGEEHNQHAPEGVRPQADGSYNIDGWMPIRDINRDLDWKLPDDKATTLAGLIINEARTIPEVGQVFSFFGFRFEILRRQRNQITAIRVTPPAPEPVDDTG
jgi:magnesium and cobalt exporter, CNNM family